jgi:hypothetical protein
MALIVRGGNLLVNSSGQPIDCSTCAVCDANCTTSCDEGICCIDGPNELTITVSSGTFGTSGCSTGNCADVEGLFVGTYRSGSPTTCIWDGTTNVNCGSFAFSCVALVGTTQVPMTYQWQVQMITPGSVRVDLLQGHVTPSGSTLCSGVSRHRWVGSLPASFDSLFDCSLSTPITCQLTSVVDLFGDNDGCFAVSTNQTITVEAV